MTKKAWKVLTTKALIESPWLSVYSQRCALPNGKIIEDFYTVEQPHWAIILAQTVNDTWVLTEQYRHGVQKYLWEFPAGIIEQGEAPLKAAQRELLEETGYHSDKWHTKQVLPVNPDRQSGHFHVFYASQARRIQEAQLDDSEDIKTQEFSTAQLKKKMLNGEFIHPHHIAAWLLNQDSFTL
ncbi:MAG: NUDIX hydrolase [Fibrobacter sp.]|nr:NUDIX hydrolase [Fibrobacter sp.]